MGYFSPPSLFTLVLLLYRLTELQGNRDHDPFAAWIPSLHGSFSINSQTGAQHNHIIVQETDTAYTLKVTIPDVSTKDLDVSVDHDERRVVVTCIPQQRRRGDDTNDANNRMIRLGRNAVLCHPSQFRVLDPSVNLHDLTMAFQDGVVTVSIPKQTVLQPTTVKTTKNMLRGGAKRGAVVTGLLLRDDLQLLAHHQNRTRTTATTNTLVWESIPRPEHSTMAAPRFTQIGATIIEDFEDLIRQSIA